MQVPPLRCKGPDFLIISVARVAVSGALYPSDANGSNACDGVFRMLADSERLACQGYMDVDNMSAMFQKTHLRRATGNAYAIPSVAAVVIPLLEQVSMVMMQTPEHFQTPRKRLKCKSSPAKS